MNWLRIGTKRALSDPITSAILLSAVATMGMFLVGWSNTTLTSNQVELEATFSNNMNKLSEKISIEKVWFGTGSNKFVSITLSNISTIGITLTEIELVNSTDTHTVTLNQNLFPGDIYKIEEEYDWTSGTSTDITVITARENHFKTQVAP